MEQKERLRRALNNVRQSYVVVGYILRQMEDSRAYEAEGYKSVAEFAEKEHGLKPSTTSRWMSINREYSLDGYSETLDPKYLDMNASQLTEMLSLPMEDRNLITADTSREEIRELKRFNREAASGTGYTPMYDAFSDFLDKNPDVVGRIRDSISAGRNDPEHIAAAVAPSGSRMYRSGTRFLTFQSSEIKIKTFGGTGQESVSWEDFMQAAAVWMEEHGEKERTEPAAAGEDTPEETGTYSQEGSGAEGQRGPELDDERRIESEHEGEDVGADDAGGTEAARGAGEHNAEAEETGRRSAAPGDENEETAAGEGHEEPADECQRVPCGESGADEPEGTESGIKEAPEVDEEVIAPAQFMNEPNAPNVVEEGNSYERDPVEVERQRVTEELKKKARQELVLIRKGVESADYEGAFKHTTALRKILQQLKG